MSSRLSAMAQFRISPVSLANYFASTPRPASSWRDWSDMCGSHDAKGRQDGLPFCLYPELPLDEVDSWLAKGDYRSHHLVLQRGRPSTTDFRSVDVSGDVAITILSLHMKSALFRDPLYFLATVRGVADHLDHGGGLAVIRNNIWSAPQNRYTLAVLCLEPGESRFLHPVDDADAYSDAVDQATRLFDGTRLRRTGSLPATARR